jgi:hypothetical protein
MNWGYKILIVYLVFVAGILLLVLKASNEKDDLVTPDYYAQELKYQQKIDQSRRASELSGEVKTELKNGSLSIEFPHEFSGKKISGNLLLYCPSSQDKDISKGFSVQDSPLVIGLPAGYQGPFEVHLTWLCQGTDYYFEKRIMMNQK